MTTRARSPVHWAGSIGGGAGLSSWVWTITFLGLTVPMGKFWPRECPPSESCDDDTLMEIMKNFLGGDCFRVVEKEGADNVKALARNFLLYGALAEVFGRANGFNRGLGGSMHAFFTPFGILPNNAIVGGSADIAMGASLFKKCNRKPGIVISNVGDASMGCGPDLGSHELCLDAPVP